VREKLTALNYSNFELCECALSDKVEKLQFFVNKDPALSGHDSLFDMREIGYQDGVDCIEVQSNTLDELTKRLGISKIDFLKIDVEGNELSVLMGARSLLSQGAIDYIQLEFGHASRAAHVYLHDIVHFVNEFDYTIFVIKPSGFMSLKFSPFTENRYSYINFLLARNDVISKLNGSILEK
jgi:FkbM family methyltransferase